MALMRHTMAVRNPETLEVHALLKGSAVPSWAEDLVDVRDTIGYVDTPESESDVDPEADHESSEPADVVGVKPDKSWTNAAIRAFADDHHIELGEASTKTDMLAAIEAA